MNRDDILRSVIDIIREEFDNNSLKIEETTVAADIEEWDSLAQLSIVHEVEKSFHIKFTVNEIKEFRNVGEMIDCIIQHLEQA